MKLLRSLTCTAALCTFAPIAGAQSEGLTGQLATNEISVRACEAQAARYVATEAPEPAKKNPDLQAAYRNLCLVLEQEKFTKVAYTLDVVPEGVRKACAIAAGKPEPSFAAMSDCLDHVLADLHDMPPNSATLSQQGKPDRRFWTLTECRYFQKHLGGVCVTR